jgi:MYXO-CTERM domain-containing protein
MVLGVVVCAAVTAANVRESDACSPWWTGVAGRTVSPEDGAVGVPRNARIEVAYDTHGGDPGSTLELRVQGGATVAVTVTTPRTIGFARLLTPTEALAASTTYELLDTLALPCESEHASDCIGEAVVIGTFTTGDALDTTPPEIVGLTLESHAYCVGIFCPEAQNEQTDLIRIVERADDFSTRWIHYEYLDAAGAVLAGPTTALTFGRGCGGGAGYMPLSEYLWMPSSFQLRAVDLAGNVETTTHWITGSGCELATAHCSPSGEDAGVDGGAATESEASGCGCQSGSPSPATALLVLLLVSGPARRRSGRTPSPARET